MSTVCSYNFLPISAAVNAAVIDCREDITKVEPEFRHWAVRGLKELVMQMQYINPLQKGIFPINKNFNSIAAPLGMKRIVFIGVIDDCGNKIPFDNNPNLTPADIRVYDCDVCQSCNQRKDICEQLNTTDTVTKVTINGNDYDRHEFKTYKNGVYYVNIAEPYLDTDTNTVKYLPRKDVIANFDLLPCGCIAPTEQNIEAIKKNCFSCYCSCFSTCLQSEYSIGEYHYFAATRTIMVSRHLNYDYLYIEWETDLPVINGEIHFPENALEVLVAYIFHKNVAGKRNRLGEVRDAFEMLRIKKQDYSIIISRMSLSTILRILSKSPKFNISYGAYCGGGADGRFYRKKKTDELYFEEEIEQIIVNPPSVVINTTIVQVDLQRFEYTGTGNEGSSITVGTLANKRVVEIEVDGVGVDNIILKTVANEVPANKQVVYTKSTGKFEFFNDIQHLTGIVIYYQEDI